MSINSLNIPIAWETGPVKEFVTETQPNKQKPLQPTCYLPQFAGLPTAEKKRAAQKAKIQAAMEELIDKKYR